MTIEQANQYFAALPDGFASTEQLRAAFTAPVQKVQFVGVAGTAGKTVTARLLAAILHAQGIHAGLYHAVESRGREGGLETPLPASGPAERPRRR